MGMLGFPSFLWWSDTATSAYFINYSKTYIGRPEESHVPTMNGLSNFADMNISRGHLEQLLCGFAASVLLNFVSAGETWRSNTDVGSRTHEIPTIISIILNVDCCLTWS